METAGKQVDEDLRELMKENGIDVRQQRILLKRYLNVNTSLEIKKQVLPTATGIQLIGTIQNDLVKSVDS
jgi:DNA topoisomerase-3